MTPAPDMDGIARMENPDGLAMPEADHILVARVIMACFLHSSSGNGFLRG